MNLLSLATIAMLVLTIILLIFLLARRRYSIIIIKVPSTEHLLEKPVITPDELREAAWESWSSAHPDASVIEQRKVQWIIEKKVHDLERRKRQPNPFSDTQNPRRG